MRFMTTDERSELRIPENDDQSDGFVVSEAKASLRGTLRLATPDIGESDNYTWMQVLLQTRCCCCVNAGRRCRSCGASSLAFDCICTCAVLKAPK